MRIFPDIWANTLCPFSSSTRNMALGSGSTTVPSTRIVSSLGLARRVHHLENSGHTSPRESAANGLRADRKDYWTPSKIPKSPCVRSRSLDASAALRQRQDFGAVVG